MCRKLSHGPNVACCPCMGCDIKNLSFIHSLESQKIINVPSYSKWKLMASTGLETQITTHHNILIALSSCHLRVWESGGGAGVGEGGGAWVGEGGGVGVGEWWRGGRGRGGRGRGWESGGGAGVREGGGAGVGEWWRGGGGRGGRGGGGKGGRGELLNTGQLL